MIQLLAIDHVCLWVRSLPEARDYYQKLFNITCRLRPGHATTLVAESEAVHFFISADATLPDEFLSRQHLSFRVDSLAEVMRRLEQMNIQDYQTGTVEFMHHRNYRWCEWRDPNGIRLECVEWLED